MTNTLADEDGTAQRHARARRDLLTGVSHHLRTPLAAMQGYLELLLLRQAELSPPERHNYVETAVRQCERLTRLVGAMSQFAELDTDAPGLHREDFALAELAHDVAQKHAALAAKRGITLAASADEAVRGQVAALAAHGDIGLVERALAQLVDNALHHTPPGGRVTIGYGGDSGGGDRVRLAVSDTGEGIAAADLRTLFGHGADGDGPAALERLPTGGLGVAIAQRIAELHGGTLDARSARGQGTTVAFSLPAAGKTSAAACSPAPRPTKPAAPAAAPAQGRLDQLERECAALRAALERNDAARSAAEADLRAAEQRYLLALRGSQDGLWEWDIASDRVHLSPRWKGMLGYETQELGDDRDTWLGCIHADDRAAFTDALRRQCATGATPDRIAHELRLLHKDGSVRHVLSRGVAIRDERGVAYRVVGVDTDVTALRRLQTVLDALADGTSQAHGAAFFPALVRNFARALGVDRAFVAQCVDEPPTRVRTLARWSAAHGMIENIEFALAGTPCAAVVQDGQACFHPANLAAMFPREQGFEAYLGMPIIGSDGRVLGHLAFFDTRPRGDELRAEPIYRIFLARAAAELERRRVAGPD